jgi:acyl-CoA thioesterase II
MDQLGAVLDTLLVEEQGQDLYLGRSMDLGWGRLYGGQLAAQAAAAANAASPVEHRLHSLHCHFLELGSTSLPVSYTVERTRNGRTYSLRRVEARQEGRLIFHCVVSLQLPEEGPSHQASMPDVPPPSDLPSYSELLAEMVDGMAPETRRQLPPAVDMRLRSRPAIEVRPVRPGNLLQPDSTEPERILWFRASETLSGGWDQHALLLVWASDFPLLGTALQPSGISPLSRRIKMASLDHSIWLYGPMKLDEWKLFHCRSPVSGGGRGLAVGEIYSQSGLLVAATAQEGMLRLRR